MGYKAFQTRPPLPSYISPWWQCTFLFRGRRPTVRCQNGSDNNYRMKPTSAWVLGCEWYELWTLIHYRSDTSRRWVSNSRCKRGLGRNRHSIPSIAQRRFYNLSKWPPETFFKGQRTWFGNTVFHLPPTYWRAAQSEYLLHFPFPNGR